MMTDTRTVHRNCNIAGDYKIGEMVLTYGIDSPKAIQAGMISLLQDYNTRTIKQATRAGFKRFGII